MKSWRMRNWAAIWTAHVWLIPIHTLIVLTYRIVLSCRVCPVLAIIWKIWTASILLRLSTIGSMKLLWTIISMRLVWRHLRVLISVLTSACSLISHIATDHFTCVKVCGPHDNCNVLQDAVLFFTPFCVIVKRWILTVDRGKTHHTTTDLPWQQILVVCSLESAKLTIHWGCRE